CLLSSGTGGVSNNRVASKVSPLKNDKVPGESFVNTVNPRAVAGILSVPIKSSFPLVVITYEPIGRRPSPKVITNGCAIETSGSHKPPIGVNVISPRGPV